MLDRISLDFQKGQSVALVGPNGSGKTTLMKCILGFVLPDAGTITVNGRLVTEGPEYRKEIGYMPQMSRFPEQMKVTQLFDLMKTIRNDVAPDQYDTGLYRELNIEAMAHKRLGTLSGGMKQQVSAALAFFFDPSIIFLDEPTAALDPLSNEILKEKIRHSTDVGKLVVASSHILNDLEEISNHFVYLMDGRLLFNETIDNLRNKTSEQKLNKIVVKLLAQHMSYAEN